MKENVLDIRYLHTDTTIAIQSKSTKGDLRLSSLEIEKKFIKKYCNTPLKRTENVWKI